MSETREILALGFSQRPWIQNGSALTVRLGTGSIRPGDLIVFRRLGVQLCHRVIWVRDCPDWAFLTKGDANWFSDGWIPESAVLGQVIAVNGESLDTWKKMQVPLLLWAGRFCLSLPRNFRKKMAYGLKWNAPLSLTMESDMISRGPTEKMGQPND